MNRKPTPQELADFISEDEHGLPVISNVGPGYGAPSVSSGPGFNNGGGQEDCGDCVTVMQQCAATGCAHNEAGRCALESIDINDTGGCAQYEACAHDDGGQGGDGSRYGEEPSDESGGMPGQQGGGQWQTGKWDPRGGGF